MNRNKKGRESMAYRSGDTVVVTKNFQDINAKVFPGDIIELTKLRQNLVELWLSISNPPLMLPTFYKVEGFAEEE